jgi:SpoVK/Ycf46/Vps4 family AAA+-type ATPase
MKLYATDLNTVLLFDEMEDIFRSDKGGASDESYSKAFINRIIETSKIPIIWTTNDLVKLGSATLRRMVYNISFQIPPARARKKIWDNYLNQYNLVIDEEIVENFALNYDMVPSLINNAVKITALTKCDTNHIPELLTKLDTLVNYGEERTFGGHKPSLTPYDASCANTDLDLNDLTSKLIDANPNFSLCLYGPPGTGKSEFGRHLAKKLGKKVLFKRASDLVSMWLGETEKNIAAAFKESSEEEMVFVIDEGDSFLRSREGAERSWEVSQVNEMLSQMEKHDQPFIITTNMIANLDSAALRRFTFKLEFKFMRPDQVAKLFKSYFGGDAPSWLMKNDILAPGDFANVKRKATILKITDLNEIAKMVDEECHLKPQKTKSIGFTK